MDHPDSWLLAAGAGVARLSADGRADREPLHPWLELELLAASAPIVPLVAFETSALAHDAAGLVMPRVAGAIAARGVSVDAIAGTSHRPRCPAASRPRWPSCRCSSGQWTTGGKARLRIVLCLDGIALLELSSERRLGRLRGAPGSGPPIPIA